MRSESTIVSEGYKGSPIMPRDVSLSDSKCCENATVGKIGLTFLTRSFTLEKKSHRLSQRQASPGIRGDQFRASLNPLDDKLLGC